MELRDGSIVVQITALCDDVLRIRAGRSGNLPEDASWAVLPAARHASVPVAQDRPADAIGFDTSVLCLEVERGTGLLRLRVTPGMSCSRTRISAVKFSRLWRFRKSAIDEFLDHQAAS